MISSKNKIKLLVILIISVVVMILAIGIGSVKVSPNETISIILYNTINNFNSISNIDFNINNINNISNSSMSIIWKIRLPRVLLAFIAGGGLAFSGAIMQAVLKNPLASSYTLGVSAGAALGASISILFNISIFGIFTLMVFGFTASILTVIGAVLLATKMDKGINNNTIILTGMAFSLFADAVISILMAYKKESLQNLIFWQMGSFASKNISYIYILYPVIVILFLLIYSRRTILDILTFGDEQAVAVGVDIVKEKWYLIVLGAVTTGIIVSVTGIIGFVDLFIPHIARNIFGNKHKYILPASFILGGMFMVICDLISRTIVSPSELPVGAITACIGAPFFIYVYINSRKNK